MSAILRTSQVLAISTSSAKFATAMEVGQKYLLISDVDCWFRVTATGGEAAAATANNVFLAKGIPFEIKAADSTNSFVHVETASGTGTANLVRVEGA